MLRPAGLLGHRYSIDNGTRNDLPGGGSSARIMQSWARAPMISQDFLRSRIAPAPPEYRRPLHSVRQIPSHHRSLVPRCPQHLSPRRASAKHGLGQRQWLPLAGGRQDENMSMAPDRSYVIGKAAHLNLVAKPKIFNETTQIRLVRSLPKMLRDESRSRHAASESACRTNACPFTAQSRRASMQ